MSSRDTIAFIGGGHMARSLIGGLLRQGMPAARVRVAEPDAAQREALARELGVSVFADNPAAVQGADTWVLAVKPAVVREVCGQLAPLATARTLLVSIAAGVRIDALARWLGPEPTIVRCMPNLPALVGAGVTGIYAGTGATSAQRERVAGIFWGVGSTVAIEHEAQLDALTAVSGSGPAYLFLLAEAMEQAARQLGLAEEVSREIVVRTLHGAAQLLADSAQRPAELRRQVASPGGTTEAALSTLAAGDFAPLLVAAVKRAAERSDELSRQWGGAGPAAT